MTLAHPLGVDEFSDSPYARELRRGVSGLRFDRDLEELFGNTHLRRVRARVRAWSTLLAVMTPLLTVVLLVSAGAHSFVFWLHAVGLAPCALIMGWLAWSQRYEQWYAPVARILVPLSGAMSAIYVAGGVGGQDNELAGLTLEITAAFFFSGLLFRPALFCASLIIVAYPIAGTILGVPQAEMFKDLIVLVLTAAIGAFVARDTEQSFRKNFLEDALIADLVARDGLSGLMNRRAFDEHLMRVWQQAQRDRRALAILMVDIDNFKGYNDAHGHQAGDAALRGVAQLLRSFARRPLDIAARYGGEEFAVILYDLSLTHVQDVAERARQAVQATIIANHDSTSLPAVTISIGIGVVTPLVGRTPQGAIQLADEALYEAKNAGRNRVVVKGPEDYRGLKTGSFRTPASAQVVAETR